MTNSPARSRRAGRGARDRHPRAGDRRAPRGPETPHPHHEPISSRRTTTGASTSGWSSWPPTTSRRCPPTGSTSTSALAVPPSVFDRSWLVMSLAQLGRFAEAAEYEAEAIRLAEPTQHAYTVGWPTSPRARSTSSRATGRRRASLIEHWIAVVRTGNVVFQLPAAVASSAWALAQLGEASEALDRLREGEQLLERQAARGLVAYRGWAYHSLGRACLLLGRLDEARRLGDRALESSPASARVRGPCAAPARRHRDPSRPVRRRERRGPLPPGAGARRAARHAPPRRPLPPRPRQALPAHRATARRPQEHLTTATTMYREMDMGFWLEKAEAELGGVER